MLMPNVFRSVVTRPETRYPVGSEYPTPPAIALDPSKYATLPATLMLFGKVSKDKDAAARDIAIWPEVCFSRLVATSSNFLKFPLSCSTVALVSFADSAIFLST